MDVQITSAQEQTVEAACDSAIARAKIARFAWAEPFSARLVSPDAHLIDFCLTPRPEGAKGRFEEYWTRSHYEQFGKVFLIPAGLAVSARAEAGQQRSLLISFKPHALSEWLDAEQNWTDRQLSASLDIKAPHIRTILRSLVSELEQPGFAGQAMVDLLNMQVAIEVARFLRSVPERSSGGLAQWRLRLIDERIQQEGAAPSLTELAALVGVSVRQLTRGFRDSRGCSIGSYIEQRRFEAACLHLSGGMSVKQTAFALGFASPSGFSYAFRAARGETPRSYRDRVHREARLLLS